MKLLNIIITGCVLTAAFQVCNAEEPKKAQAGQAETTAKSPPKTAPLTEILLAEIQVNKTPLSGEKWRQSANFSLKAPRSVQRLLWRISGAPPQSKTSFSVAEDVEWGGDPTLLPNLTSGVNTAVIGGNNIDTNKLYIGGTSPVKANFVVQIFGLVRK